MALDIKEGDYLVVGSKEYPIRFCEEWAWNGGNGIRRMLRVTASTKRQPAIVDGKRGTPVTKLSCVKCTPLDSINQYSPDIRNRRELDTPHELLQTVVDGGDVFYQLYLEDLKR